MRRLEVAVRRLVRREARQSLVNLLNKVRPEDVAVLLRGLTPAEQLKILHVMMEEFPDTVGDVLTELGPHQRLELLGRLTPEQIGGIVERAAIDDAVYLIESLPSELREEVLDLVDVKDLKELQSHLTYADDTAGRIMDTVYFSMPESATVSDAIAAIRQLQDVEMIFYLYVTDDAGHLRGVTSLRQLLVRRPERTLGEIMQPDLIKVSVDTDQEVVAQLAARYDLLAIPVTDDSNRLVGIVT
ncbi:MAG: magnesium transporter, partial [Acidobacteria bacterium]|nr:magnesium transporter [Acidobacteriota bacterium]